MGENGVNNSENKFAYKMFNSVKYGKLLICITLALLVRIYLFV